MTVGNRRYIFNTYLHTYICNIYLRVEQTHRS